MQKDREQMEKELTKYKNFSMQNEPSILHQNELK